MNKRNKKAESEVEFLVNVSFERFTDERLLEISPDEYAKILEENLKEETKKFSGGVIKQPENPHFY